MSAHDGVTVRRGTPADADAAGRLLHDFNTEFDSPTPSAAVLAGRLRTLLGREDVALLLALGEGAGGGTEPVGLALVTERPTPYHDGPFLQLEELYVRPHLRDQGIGTHLMEALLERAAARSAGEIHINVDDVDTDTRRFYERHGFVNAETDLAGREYRMLCYIREL